jgi:hypothetical protein
LFPFTETEINEPVNSVPFNATTQEVEKVLDKQKLYQGTKL